MTREVPDGSLVDKRHGPEVDYRRIDLEGQDGGRGGGRVGSRILSSGVRLDGRRVSETERGPEDCDEGLFGRKTGLGVGVYGKLSSREGRG